MHDDPCDPSEIQEKLDTAPGDLADAILRRNDTDDWVIVDDKPERHDGIMEVDGLQGVIRGVK
jgi:hypothetical protein